MKCPNCSLENPPDGQICDCGYNFIAKKQGRSLDSKYYEKLSTSEIIGVLLLPVILGLLYFFQYRKTRPIKAKQVVILFFISMIFWIISGIISFHK